MEKEVYEIEGGERMKKKKDLKDVISRLMIGIIIGFALSVMVVSLINVNFPEKTSMYTKGFQDGAKSTQQNITTAYYQGLVYWQTSGKLVYAKQDFTGQIQFKEITLEEVCENG